MTITSRKVPENKNKRPEPVIEWNNKTEESFLESGFDLNQAPQTVFESNSEEKRFLSQVDTRQAPIERTVWNMVRFRDIDHSDPKQKRKEWIIFHEQWEGKNFRGLRIAPVTSHCEGRWYETMTSPELDPETGEIHEYKFDKFRPRYDIPLARKKIDEIISKSVHSDKDSIKYVIKLDSNDFPGSQGPSTHTSYTYEQFAEWSFDEIFKYATRPREKRGDFTKASIQSSTVMNQPVQ